MYSGTKLQHWYCFCFQIPKYHIKLYCGVWFNSWYTTSTIYMSYVFKEHWSAKFTYSTIFKWTSAAKKHQASLCWAQPRLAPQWWTIWRYVDCRPQGRGRWWYSLVPKRVFKGMWNYQFDIVQMCFTHACIYILNEWFGWKQRNQTLRRSKWTFLHWTLFFI